VYIFYHLKLFEGAKNTQKMSFLKSFLERIETQKQAKNIYVKLDPKGRCVLL